MSTPTQKQFQIIINNLNTVYLKFEKDAPVYMMAIAVNYCGSPMCHAGWYAVAKKLDEWESSYRDGANAMAVDLGFESAIHLKHWAKENPEIWGNAFGMEMFADGSAFGGTDESINSLNQIIDYWKGVKKRALQSI